MSDNKDFFKKQTDDLFPKDENRETEVSAASVFFVCQLGNAREERGG